MELKPYQQRVIDDLGDYLRLCNPDYIKGYNTFWKFRGLGDNAAQPYQDTIKGCPHICLKVPTAGGKTFIACNALKTIFDNYPSVKEKVVVWLVPSNTILTQTIKNLSNPDHPYNQKIRSLFNGRFEVFTKNQIDNGIGFTLSSIKNQLNIIVLSFASIRAKDKESRKLHQENGNLLSFQNDSRFTESYVEGVDPTSASNVLYNLNPVVIIDESHNAESDLSIDMLKTLNPSFILDLTATPKKNSNIISYVSAIELKKENMVKLPVIAYNMQSKEDVINGSIDMQRSLEVIAMKNEVEGGNYIRPIVIFQASQKNVSNSDGEDIKDFLKLKEYLIKSNIKPEEIAIQTATIKELNGVDLLSKDCKIRYIITINALKEGRDCPFAYILASLANRSSEVDVTQILGRILRQPYTKQHNDPLLNMSYVFTASQKFQQTLQNIIEGLNQAGLSKKSFRISEETDESGFVIPHNEFKENLLLGHKDDELDFSKVKLNDSSVSIAKNIIDMQNKAINESKVFESNINQVTDSEIFWGDLLSKVSQYSMDESFKDDALKIKLPKFCIKVNNSLFPNGEKQLEKVDLYKGFNILQEDTKINFEELDNENLKELDLIEIGNGDSKWVQSNAKIDIRQKIINYIKGLPEDKQILALSDLVYEKVKDENIIPQKDLKEYIKRVIKGLNQDQLDTMKQQPQKYAEYIKKKISKLKDMYAWEQLKRGLESDIIYCKACWEFPETINVEKTTDGIIKSLYEVEGETNDFERMVIDKIANAENVKWWHRNIDTKGGTGFFINGSINHYPDFIVKTIKGNILLIETKGEQLTNFDSDLKIKLGNLWSQFSGKNFKYYMLFKENKMENSYTVNEFMDLLKDL